MYASVCFLQEREKERKKEGAYLDLRRTVLLRKKRKRISRVAITRVPTHPLLLLLSLLLPSSSSSSRCPFVVRPRRRSPFPQRRTFFIVAREKDFLKEKDEKKAKNAEEQKKMCQTDEKKRRGAEVFSTPFFLSIPFPNQNPHQRARAHSIGALLNISFLRFFLRFFVFLSPKRSIHSSRTSRWSRARACIYISRNARSRRVSLERRDEKKREKERKRRVHETTIPEEKGKRKKKDRIVFSERSFA